MYDESYYHNAGIEDPSNGYFIGYDNYLEDEDNIRLTFSKRLKTIESYIPPGRLLDIGCATGFFLDLARQRGWQVTGTEVSAFSVQFARQRFGLDVRLGTLRQIGFPSASFEVVVMWDVIEHVPDPLAELREIHRITVPEGVLSIITPDVSSLVARLLGPRWEEFRRVREHLYFFSRQTLKAMLWKTGFEILKVESADKVFYLGPAVRRLRYYTYDGLITNTLAKLVKQLNLEHVRVNVNPFTKMAVYARRCP